MRVVQSKMDWHLTTQNKDYLDLSIKRLNEPALIWVSQFTEIINSKIKSFDKPLIRINDIGCNVGHFYRNVNEINAKINYTGFGISQTYLDIAQDARYRKANVPIEVITMGLAAAVEPRVHPSGKQAGTEEHDAEVLFAAAAHCGK